MQTAGTKTFTVWVVEAKESPNEILRSVLESEAARQATDPVMSVRFVPEADVSKPLRFALLPDLIIVSCEFRPAFDAFIKGAGGPPVWLDLTYQTGRTLELFRAMCQMRGLEGSALELSQDRLPWALRLLDAYRFQRGSLLYCAVGGGESAPAPVIHSTRLSRAEQIGVRIDHLATVAGGTASAFSWYSVLSCLTSLALDIAEEVKGTSTPVLPLYGCELGDRTWLVLYQIPVAKKHQSKLPQLMALIREDQGLRARLPFRLLTRECGALAVTFSENLIELGVIFNPAEISGERLLESARGGNEAIVFRKRHYSREFNPQECRYQPFPERLRPVEKEIEAEPAAETEGGALVKLPAVYEKAKETLSNVHRIGSDESFAAYLKGVDASTSAAAQPRYLRLIEGATKAEGAETGELLKDLLKRFFMLVENARERRSQRGGG